MSHSLYELTDEPEGTVYRLLRTVRLTAESGAIASFVRAARDMEPGGWRMTERDLVEGVGGDSDAHAVVVDLKPHARGIVNLYRIRGIVGYSHEDWTPLCFLLEKLFDDEPEPDPERFKRRFARADSFRGTNAVSFVYLRRGTRGGAAWNWGHIGRVNGAILFPNAWQYFGQELRTLGWLA
jgi:hypothetical protein